MNESDEDSFDVMNSYSRRELARKLLMKLVNTKKPITNELLWKVDKYKLTSLSHY
jgi:hypothetical protein